MHDVMYYGGVTIHMKVASKLTIHLKFTLLLQAFCLRSLLRVYSLCCLSIYLLKVFYCVNSNLKKQEEFFIDEFPILFWYNQKRRHVLAWGVDKDQIFYYGLLGVYCFFQYIDSVVQWVRLSDCGGWTNESCTVN